LVALKVIAAPLAGDPRFRERFRREATAAASIEHPHVVPVYEADEREGVLYLAMRLIDGVDLGTLIWRERRLDPQRAVELVAQVASALDAVHARGLIHRDVKPANVLVAEEEGHDHAYLTDFGIAKRRGGHTLTRAGSVVGTLDYLAPEAFRGEPVGPGTDIYALGCVLYEALTGEVPFPHQSEAAKVSAHLHESPLSLRDHAPDLSEALDGVVQRALAKQPGDRFGSAGTLAAGARAALEGRLVETIVDPRSGAARGAPAVVPEPVRKSVTVLYSLLAGVAGEGLDPELRAGALPGFFERARRAIEGHGGTCTGPVGDAVVGIFGLAELHEDDALRAARSAIDLHRSVGGQEAEPPPGIPSLIPTSAIATGVVLASEGSADLAVAGGVVEAAARLCQFGQSGRIALSDATRALVKDAVELEPPPAPTEGRRVAGWALLSVRPGAEALRRRLDAPLVGRDREHEQLHHALERCAQDRSPGLVTVLAAPGLGKSRLAQEFQLAIEGRATAVAGRCLPYGEGITFWPVAEILRQLGGPDPIAGIARILGPGTDVPAIADQLTGLLGLREGGTAADEIFWAVRKFLAAAAHDRPLVVVFEDIHWAEPTLLELIEHLAEWTRDSALMLLCLARPELLERWPGWAAGRVNAASIVLEPLSIEDSQAVISGLPGGPKLDEETRQRILEAADGNPLFVEQMLALARDQAARTLQPDVPVGIKALLAARLELLAPPERDLLGRAAIIGKEFWPEAVKRLLGDGRGPALGDALTGLVRKDFIEPSIATGLGQDEFRFRHILIRDAAYEALPKRLRGELHERLASWLEETFDPVMGEYEEIIGSHLERAYRYRVELGTGGPPIGGLRKRAADRLGSAGRRALARSDLSAAANLLDRAALLLDERDPLRLELRLDAAGALIERGELDRAERVLDEVVEAADALGDRRLLYHAQIQRSDIAILAGTSAGVQLAHAEQAVQAFEEVGDELGLARAWMLRGVIDWLYCRARSAASAYQHAADHAKRAEAERQEEEGLFWVCAAHTHGPTPVREALAYCENALAETLSRRRLRGQVLSNHLALLKAYQGDFDEARTLYTRGQAVVEELGLEVVAGFSTQALAWIEMGAGEPAAAEAALRQGCEILERLGEKAFLSTNAAMLAEALHRQGADDEAERFLDIAEAAGAQDDIVTQVQLRATRAKLVAGRGDPVEAERLAREALTLAARTDFFVLEPIARLALALALVTGGRNTEAIPMIEAARSCYAAKGDVVSGGHASEWLAQLGAD
jgi:class 3 adenylate cyclase/tetratricopeptide (TPR) repeat protein